MNWDRIEGNWKQFKGKVKEQWGELTDDQIDVIDGRRDQLAGQDSGSLRRIEGRSRASTAGLGVTSQLKLPAVRLANAQFRGEPMKKLTHALVTGVLASDWPGPPSPTT